MLDKKKLSFLYIKSNLNDFMAYFFISDKHGIQIRLRYYFFFFCLYSMDVKNNNKKKKVYPFLLFVYAFCVTVFSCCYIYKKNNNLFVKMFQL